MVGPAHLRSQAHHLAIGSAVGNSFECGLCCVKFESSRGWPCIGSVNACITVIFKSRFDSVDAPQPRTGAAGPRAACGRTPMWPGRRTPAAPPCAGLHEGAWGVGSDQTRTPRSGGWAPLSARLHGRWAAALSWLTPSPNSKRYRALTCFNSNPAPNHEGARWRQDHALKLTLACVKGLFEPLHEALTAHRRQLHLARVVQVQQVDLGMWVQGFGGPRLGFSPLHCLKGAAAPQQAAGTEGQSAHQFGVEVAGPEFNRVLGLGSRAPRLALSAWRSGRQLHRCTRAIVAQPIDPIPLQTQTCTQPPLLHQRLLRPTVSRFMRSRERMSEARMTSGWRLCMPSTTSASRTSPSCACVAQPRAHVLMPLPELSVHAMGHAG